MLTAIQLYSLSPLIVVSITATLLMLMIAFVRHHSLNATLSVIGLNVALFATLVAWAAGAQAITELLAVDHYACFFIALMLVATLASTSFAHTWSQQQPGNREEMFLLMLLSLAGGIVLVCSRHFASLFIGLEMLSIPLYGLVAYSLRRSRSLEAGIKYLVLSATGSALMLFGMALLYAQFGTLSFAGIGQQLSQLTPDGSLLNPVISPMILSGVLLVIVALSFKLSLVPFHLWTPDVYEGAPAPVGAYLATTAKIAVAAALLRFMDYLLPALGQTALPTLLMLLAGLSILVGNLLAMIQNNFKRLLGYSSIAHFGYLMLGIAALNLATMEALMVYLFSYALATLAAFGVVSMISSQQSPDNEADELYHYRGLFWKQPWLASVLTIALLSMAGIPATVGFIGKFYVIFAAVIAGLWWPLAALVIGSAIGVYFYLRVIMTLFLAEPGTQRVVIPFSWSRACSMAALLLIALMIIVLGVFPEPLLELASLGDLL